MVMKLVIDALLVIGFGVQHSILATLVAKKQVKRFTCIDSLTWRGIQSMLNVLYILIAAALWQSVDVQIWNLTGIVGYIVAAIGVAAWLWYFQLHLCEYDVGLAFGSTPFISVALGREIPRIEQWKVGTRRWIRFPVHTAFFPMFFAIPHMTLSTLVLAVTANIYNIIGTILYDKRLEKLAGKLYFNYQAVTGIILPRLSKPQGAAGMDLPRPTHWNIPSRYLIATFLGIIGGLIYRFLLGTVTNLLPELLRAWLVSIGVSLVAGMILGIVYGNTKFFVAMRNKSSYQDLQAVFSTSAAIVSAVSLITWVTTTFMTLGTIPTLAVILPLWITVLWLGHVMLFFTCNCLGRGLVGLTGANS